MFLLRYIYRKFLEHYFNRDILKWSDKNSYYIYLVHQLIILGSFSICLLLQSTIVAIALTLFVIIINSIMLRKLSERVKIFIASYTNFC